jgi:hypothetical protein
MTGNDASHSANHSPTQNFWPTVWLIHLQYRHYQALLDIFKLQPTKESKELAELAMFVAQVG